jgi:hypothetical protein
MLLLVALGCLAAAATTPNALLALAGAFCLVLAVVRARKAGRQESR